MNIYPDDLPPQFDYVGRASENYEAVQRFMRFWAPHLGLHDWNVRIRVSDKTETFWMETHFQYDYDTALIVISHRCIGLEPMHPDSAGSNPARDEVRLEEIVVHELMHLVLQKKTSTANKIKDELPDKVQFVYETLEDQIEEEICEEVARTLVRMRRSEVTDI